MSVKNPKFLISKKDFIRECECILEAKVFSILTRPSCAQFDKEGTILSSLPTDHHCGAERIKETNTRPRTQNAFWVRACAISNQTWAPFSFLTECKKETCTSPCTFEPVGTDETHFFLTHMYVQDNMFARTHRMFSCR